MCARPASLALPRERRRAWLRLGGALVLLCLAAALPYLPYLDGYFLADDLFLDYFLLEDGALSLRRVAYHFFPRAGYTERQIYRPVSFVLLAGEYYFWGPNPVGYHLTNVALHAATTLLVFFLILRLRRGGELLPPVCGALLFALHPLHPEAVQWIVGRVDLTPTFFTLLALLAFLRYRRGRGRRFGLLTLGATLGALAAKESAVAVPLYLLALDLTLRDRRRETLGIHAAAWLLVGLYLLFRWWCFGSVLGQYGAAQPPLFAALREQWRVALAQGLGLLRHLLVPVRAGVFQPGEALALKVCVLAGLSALVFVGVAWGFRSGRGPSRAALFALLWFPLTVAPLLPVFLLLPVTAEHLNARLAYLPGAAFAVALPLVLFGDEPWRDRLWVQLRAVAAAILPLAYLPLTLVHAGLFHAAGETVREIQGSVLRRAAEEPPGTPVLFSDVPREWHGVYTLRTGLAFLFRPPLAPRTVPVLALSLTSPAELGRFLYRHPRPPLLLRWTEERGVELLNRPLFLPPPPWTGQRLGELVAEGGRLLRGELRLPGPGARSLRTPPLYVQPGGVAALILRARLLTPGKAALQVRLRGRGVGGERLDTVLSLSPPLKATVWETRILPLRQLFSVYARRRGGQVEVRRWLEAVEILVPAGAPALAVQEVALTAELPRLAAVGPPPGAVFRLGGAAPAFGFRPLAAYPYYKLVIDLSPAGPRGEARFDARKLPRRGDAVWKPLSRAGNLSPKDFAVDLSALPRPRGQGRLAFLWWVEALLDPHKPWLVVARTPPRRAYVE